MGNVTGALTRIIGWPEATWNTTPGTPNGRLIPVVSFGLRANEERETDPTLSGYRGQQRSSAGKRDVAGPINITVAPETIGFWLANLIGTPTTAGVAAPYTHSFAVNPTGAGALPPGIGFEVDYGAGITGAGRYIVYSGARINQMTLNLPANGNITAQIDILGANFDADNVATLDGTPTDTGHNVWKAQKALVVFDGGALSVCLESLQVSLGNDLDADRWCVGNGGIRHDLPEGQFIASGQAVAYFDTAALMNKALNDTDASLVITLTKGTGAGTAGNEELVITIPALVFAANTPAVDGPRGLKLQADFTSHRTTGETGVTAVLKNALATVI